MAFLPLIAHALLWIHLDQSRASLLYGTTFAPVQGKGARRQGKADKALEHHTLRRCIGEKEISYAKLV